MAGIRKRTIAAVLEVALQTSGARLVETGLTGRGNADLPWTCTADLAGRTRSYRCYFWTITHGGNHRSRSEYRIQTMLTSTERRLAFGAGTTLLLGYYDSAVDDAGRELGHNPPAEMGLFVAWDATRHVALGYSSSCQVAYEQLFQAYVDGVCARSRSVSGGASEMVIALRPEYLASYFLEASGGHDGVEVSRLRSQIG